MKTFRLGFEILSPIHIGSGNGIDPLDYIIKEARLYRLSLENLIIGMDDIERERFEELINKGDLMEIRKYISERINTERDSLYSVEVSQEVMNLYNTKIGDIQNQLLISPFIRTEGGARPLIPGSSIKGAIRTAVISELAKNSNLPKPKDFKEEKEFESKVLGYKDGKDDPFRGIKIRDKTLPEDSTIIRRVRNVSKKEGGLQPNEIQIICEVSHSYITGKPLKIETSISFDDSLFSTNFLSMVLTKGQVIKSCRDFYRNKMEMEHNKFYKNSKVESLSTQLLETPFDEDSFLLRIGRFSGVESVTLDNYRNPKPPGNKRVWGTSKNIVEGIYPMGWVKVTVSELT